MHFFEIIPLIQTIGMIGIFLFVFAESGLFFGFFLPGDSLLFSAGLLAASGYLNIEYLVIGCTVFAILGDAVGYWFGRKVGYKIFFKEESFFFSKKNIDKTKLFFERHGKKAILLARFVPIVRTFTPILAGVGKMNYKSFAFYNASGGILWSAAMLLLGYFLGGLFPDLQEYMLLLVVLIIVISFLPMLRFLKKNRQE
jgi:membrane-associated protein